MSPITSSPSAGFDFILAQLARWRPYRPSSDLVAHSGSAELAEQATEAAELSGQATAPPPSSIGSSILSSGLPPPNPPRVRQACRSDYPLRPERAEPSCRPLHPSKCQVNPMIRPSIRTTPGRSGHDCTGLSWRSALTISSNFFDAHEHRTRLAPLARTDHATLFEQVHDPTGASEPDFEFALQHRRRAELASNDQLHGRPRQRFVVGVVATAERHPVGATGAGSSPSTPVTYSGSGAWRRQWPTTLRTSSSPTHAPWIR